MPTSARARRGWPGADLSKLREVEAKDLAIRFAFGAAISMGAGLLGKLVSARFGGVFLAFPAILPASLTLIQNKEGTRRADRNAVGAVLGGLALAVFAGIGEAAFAHLPSGLVLALAGLGWIVTSLLLYALLSFLVPDATDQSKD